jgi:hypothetical protein
MADIIINPEFEKLVSEVQGLETKLADLVYERDKLTYHVCPQLQTEYLLKIGRLEYAVFEYQGKILRIKREIEMIQAKLNREEPFDIVEIEKQLEIEYKEYTEELLEKEKEIEEAKFKKDSMGRPLTEEEVAELKSLYTYIVKKLHPDLNPDTTEKEHSLFSDAVTAYKDADLSELRVINLVEKIEIGTTLHFVREPDNKYDELAILVKDKEGNKMGYVPRYDNPVLARLMDAGKTYIRNCSRNR